MDPFNWILICSQLLPTFHPLQSKYLKGDHLREVGLRIRDFFRQSGASVGHRRQRLLQVHGKHEMTSHFRKASNGSNARCIKRQNIEVILTYNVIREVELRIFYVNLIGLHQHQVELRVPDNSLLCFS